MKSIIWVIKKDIEAERHLIHQLFNLQKKFGLVSDRYNPELV
jgi:hypothetical protein